MHGIYQNQTFMDAAFSQAFLHLWCDVGEVYAGWNIEPDFFAKTFHLGYLCEAYDTVTLQQMLGISENYTFWLSALPETG
jgi:hypothetical protein